MELPNELILPPGEKVDELEEIDEEDE